MVDLLTQGWQDRLNAAIDAYFAPPPPPAKAETAYDMGKIAFLGGKPFCDNPFHLKNADGEVYAIGFLDWNFGWNDARDNINFNCSFDKGW